MKIVPGQVFESDGIRLMILSHNHLADKILASAKLPVSTVEIGANIPVDSAVTQAALHNIIFNIAKSLAPELLIKPAMEISAKLGFGPAQWRISKARKRALGTCSSRRVISFSPLLVFASRELREYIACHELAHLTYFNHSRDFHALCNRYCMEITGKPEAYFKSRMKTIFRDKDSLVYSLAASPFPAGRNR